jgi:ATP-dependent protease ClpP protease subunit
MIVAGGERGHRHALPTSQLSIVPIYTPPDAEDPSHQEKERVLSQIVEVMVEHTGQSEDAIRDAFIHGKAFSANEAKEYGLIDAISD